MRKNYFDPNIHKQYAHLMDMNIKELLSWHQENWISDDKYPTIKKGEFKKVIEYFLNIFKTSKLYKYNNYSHYKHLILLSKNLDIFDYNEYSFPHNSCIDANNSHTLQIMSYYFLFRGYTIIDIVKNSDKVKYEKEMQWESKGICKYTVNWSSEEYEAFNTSLCLWNNKSNTKLKTKYHIYFWDSKRLKTHNKIHLRIKNKYYAWFVLYIFSNIYHWNLNKFNFQKLLTNEYIINLIKERIILYHYWFNNMTLDYHDKFVFGGGSISLMLGHRGTSDIDMNVYISESEFTNTIKNDIKKRRKIFDIEHFNEPSYKYANYNNINSKFVFYMFGFKLYSIEYTVVRKLTRIKNKESYTTASEVYFYRTQYNIDFPYYDFNISNNLNDPDKAYKIIKKRLYFRFGLPNISIKKIEKDYIKAKKVNKNTVSKINPFPNIKIC